LPELLRLDFGRPPPTSAQRLLDQASGYPKRNEHVLVGPIAAPPTLREKETRCG
jgi:hypothetical protein